ncbi:MAG TPA: bifunctional adenosylcobinamide kinase/adenosylcobinamide-phosphate guanylyltransferase [Rubrobacteraceae bacterium]|nr:bifunctional adenosylcobinamide kinase/adenosylcobinamide-phosphate guanylyltransferase [Rubrobacteraceae bacterium]
MRTFCGARTRLLPGSSTGGGGERAVDSGAAGRVKGGGAVAVHALFIGGARSGKSALAEERALSLGGENVLYVATAFAHPEDPELLHRIEEHRERRSLAWDVLELEGGSLAPVLATAGEHGAVLLDSLTLWVSARMLGGDEDGTLEEFERLVTGVSGLSEPVILVSDEVGLGVVPESAEGRRFRDLLGLVNQRAAAAAEEVYLCVAGIGSRVK